jgi:hypothetical protein
VIVIFSPAEFKAEFPEFAGESDASLNGNFIEAEMHLNNTESSPVTDEVRRKRMLYLLVAHFTKSSKSGNAGRVAQVSEGSQSVSFEGMTITERNAYYSTTTYGARYWALARQLLGPLTIPAQQRARVYG